MNHHHHAEPLPSGQKQKRIYLLAILLNVLFVIAETIMGFLADSLGLISDAGHNLSDVFSLLLAFLAVQLASSHTTKHLTYGYRKTSVLISMLNAIILLIAVGAIMVRAFSVLTPLSSHSSPSINGEAITWTAGIGILINSLTTLLLHKDSHHDINARGAYLHMLSDTLVSVGVVISGLIITYTEWYIVDPIISIVIAIIILISTLHLLRESFRMSIDAVPSQINPDHVRTAILSVTGVSDVHHIHIWAISTQETALTAHVLINDKTYLEDITQRLKQTLSQMGITHSTLELETPLSHCHNTEC